MHILVTILLTVLIFGVLILVHELGHYLAARAFKIGVNEFSIGFGPKLFQKQGKYNLISIRALPFGGYVSMVGETEDVEDEALKECAFRNKPIWQRFIVAIAGSFMNILIGLIVMAVLISTQESYGSTTIAAFNDNAVSNIQGLEVGDTITKINGEKINTLNDLIYAIQIDGVEPLDITVLRDGEEKTLTIQFNQVNSDGITIGEIDFKVKSIKKDFSTVVQQIYHQSVSNVKMVYSLIWKTITGRFGIEGVSGPIGIGEAVGEASKGDQPVQTLLWLFVTIALNLGIFNLLPIPMLDGGMILFLIYEAIFRKRVPQKVESTLTVFFMFLLILLAIVVAFKDVIKLFV